LSAVCVLAFVVAAGEPLLFRGHFAGDAVVHLAFAESAAHGRFFEFNPAERVSGETSPGYMLLGALFFRSTPAVWVPVALKVAGLAGWYALCWLVYRVAVRLLREPERAAERAWPALAALVAAALPGSVYNANVGMENGLFAALIWWWILLADRWRWFESVDGNARRELTLAAMLGVSCWVRPEGWLVLLVAFGFRLVTLRPPLGRWLLGLGGAAGLGAACVAFQLAFTGDVIPTSVLSRRVLAMPNTYALGGVVVDPTLAKRLMAYFPLTALFAWGWRSGRRAVSATERFLRTMLLAFLVAYTLGGSPQLGRYLIFLMPALAIGATRGARDAWRSTGRTAKGAVLLAALAMLGIDVVEAHYRMLSSSERDLRAAMQAPALRRESTDRFLRDLGDPTWRPVIVAFEAIQARYELDPRILVRSLDGRADRALLGFVRGGVVDHLGYLRARHVEYLANTPTYNRDRSAWSLASLGDLPPGDSVERDGVRLTRLEGEDIYRVSSR
jgi:hypothetical protein